MDRLNPAEPQSEPARSSALSSTAAAAAAASSSNSSATSSATSSAASSSASSASQPPAAAARPPASPAGAERGAPAPRGGALEPAVPTERPAVAEQEAPAKHNPGLGRRRILQAGLAGLGGLLYATARAPLASAALSLSGPSGLVPSGAGASASWAPAGARRRARAKSVIFLFMYGGPSQVDTFDYKPELYKHDGKTIDIPTFGRQGKRPGGRVVGPKWRFRPYGQCGRWVSDLFPNLAQRVDDIAFVHSFYAESPIHGSALLNMNTGRIVSGHPSIGAWANYGRPSSNPNLPGHVVLLDPAGGPISGAKNWTSGYMPASLQGVTLRTAGTPILDLDPPAALGDGIQRLLLDHLAEENRLHADPRAANPELAARSAQFELAYRMQSAAPEAVDLGGESAATRELYGLDRSETADFAKKCLLARRLVERGVRFITVYSGGGHNDDCWDAHGDLVYNHSLHAGRTDRPIAGLLTDLKQRGLLEETLVVWGGEFGRQPTAEYESGTGRDHNAWGFTMWLAGGGVKGGIQVGTTDELGARAVDDRYHVRNLHATILDRLGLDPNDLSYPFQGLDQKLVGVEGAEPIQALLA
jgi:hypothetical protein